LEEVVSRAAPAVVLIESSAGRGSGFFVKADTIVTNAHVVGTATSVTVRKASGESIRASVQTVSSSVDLAVLKTLDSPPTQATIPLAEASRVRAGQEVTAIGSPLGVFQNSVTRGIVSSVRRLDAVTLIQTDAAINPGNSGGPLLDRHGDAIGVATMGVRASQGLSFAVAADHAQALLDGERPPSATTTPLSSLNATLQAPGASDSEQARQKATSAYREALAQLSQRADSLDDYWRRFKAACYAGRIGGSLDREWFAVFDPRAMQGTVALGCEASFAEVKRYANEIRDRSQAAEEAARRADVYPGTRRDARRTYRLAYPGWDR
jgi:V8-like Glu-specific endopeptidase